MNKLFCIITLAILTASVGLKAQTSTGTPSQNYSIIENKLKKSDANLTDSDKTAKPKFWISRAELLMDAYEVNRKFLIPGTPKLQVKLIFLEPKETKTWQEGANNFEQWIYDRVNVILKDGVVDSYEETKPLYNNPIPEALKALEKAQKLDVENKSKKDYKTDYDKLKKDFENLAIEQFGKKDFEGSYNSFSSITNIDEKPIMEGVIDTVAFYNTGLAAYHAKKTDEAIKYFELARKYNHPDANLYILLEQTYLTKGDSSQGVTVLEEGFKRFPNDPSLQIELINYFLNKGEAVKALNYLKVAQQADPKNISFIFAEGTLYDKLGQSDKSIVTYQRCIDIDPKYYDAYYNLGVVYYNRAVKLFEEATALTDQKQYEAAKSVANDELAKVVPYMETAYKIAKENTDWPVKQKQDNIESVQATLKTLYYRLQMTDKSEVLKKEMSGE
jgi:tetratricopeptide (TPR) repeat protein